jgi:hypothetical protein
MMMWQLDAVAAFVAVAAAYLGWRAWRTWGRKASGCGGCGTGCKTDSSAAPPAPRFIPVDKLGVRKRGPG